MARGSGSSRGGRSGRSGFEGSPEIGPDRKSRDQVEREVREGRQAVEDTRAERENRQDKGFLERNLAGLGQSLAPPTGADPGMLRNVPVIGSVIRGKELFENVTGLESSQPDPRFREPSRDSDNNRTGRQLEAVPSVPAAPAPVAPVPVFVPGDPANVGLRGRRRRRLLGADETGLFRAPTLLGRQ